MLSEVLAHLRNYFEVGRYEGCFRISGGAFVSLPAAILGGQYIRIIGSVFNDGVCRADATNLTDETFTGTICALAVPPAVIALSDEISKWVADGGGEYVSERFGDYSYTRPSGSDGRPLSWQEQFRSRLNAWRKI